MKKYSVKRAAQDIAECAIFVAIMVASAFVSIPFPLVPLTFQTVVSVLAGLLLGWKKGAASMAVYCVAGLIGIPVFTQGGGIFYVLKPSFGFIIGFIFSAAVAGLVAGKPNLKFWRYAVGALAAFLVDYLVGIPYSVAVGVSLNYSVGYIVVYWGLIFIPNDAVFSLLAAGIAWR